MVAVLSLIMVYLLFLLLKKLHRAEEDLEDERSNAVVKRFSENHRITGSRQSESAQEGGNEGTASPDPVADPPNMVGAQQPLLN